MDEPAPILPHDARCLSCGYLLRSLPENACPECGRPFDPANPLTYRLPRAAWWQAYANQPSTIEVAVALLLFFIFLNAFSLPLAKDHGVACWSYLGLLLITYVYGARCIAVMLARRRVPGWRPDKSRAWRWLAWPLLIVFVVSCLATRWPLRLRFHLSREALEGAVNSSPVPSRRQGPLWIGLYPVDSIERSADGGAWLVTGRTLIERTGFRYLPQDNGPASDRIAEGWYEGER